MPFWFSFCDKLFTILTACKVPPSWVNILVYTEAEFLGKLLTTFITFVWTAMCILRCAFWINVWPHSWHLKFLTPVWDKECHRTCMWTLPHSWQANLLHLSSEPKTHPWWHFSPSPSLTEVYSGTKMTTWLRLHHTTLWEDIIIYCSLQPILYLINTDFRWPGYSIKIIVWGSMISSTNVVLHLVFQAVSHQL